MLDVILKGGKVYDGTGIDAVAADVGIRDGLITEVGNLATSYNSETLVIDVSGLAVASGFVDMHTHSDLTLVADARAERQVHQGVTTELIGQCGISCAPVCSHNDIRNVSPWYTDQAKHPNWLGFGQYLDTLDMSELGVKRNGVISGGRVIREFAAA